MASLKQVKSVTPVWATIQRVVILGPVNSQPEQRATRVVQLAVQAIASWLRRRSYVGSPGMTGAMSLSFVPVTPQRAQRISLHQTVRNFPSPRTRWFSYILKVGVAGVEGLRAPTAFAHHWTMGFLRFVHSFLTGADYA